MTMAVHSGMGTESQEQEALAAVTVANNDGILTWEHIF